MESLSALFTMRIDRLLEMQSSDGTIHYQYTYATGTEPIEVTDLVHKRSLHRNEYNPFGELLQEINPYGLTYTWEYDDHGRCIAYTLPRPILDCLLVPRRPSRRSFQDLLLRHLPLYPSVRRLRCQRPRYCRDSHSRHRKAKDHL